MINIRIPRHRVYILIGLVCFAFLLIAGRIAYIHFWKRNYYLSFLEKNRNTTQCLHAKRGNILDAKGRILATNEPIYTVGIDPQMTSEKDFLKIPKLATLLKLPAGHIKAAFQKTTCNGKAVRWRKLAENVSPEFFEKIKALKIRGLYGNPKFRRTYPSGKNASHIIGYLNKEGKATCGVESGLDFYLQGQDGWRETECDGKRQELLQYRRREVSARHGHNVVLSIDSVVQDILESELKVIQRDYQPQSASIIVSEAKTGFILGLANSPSYNPNAFSQSEIKNQRNRCITDIFEPGSAFKIVTLSALLEEKLLPLKTVIDCNQPTTTYKGKTYNLPKDWKALGKLTIPEVFRFSSNRGVAKIALKLGRDKLFRYARSFGFGEKTGFPLDSEVNGILPAPHKWDDLTVTRLPVGHGMAATPMQVHFATSVLANNGILAKPQIVRRIEDTSGAIVLSFSPQEKRRVLSEKTAKKAAKILERNDPNIRIEGTTVSGKTSTSQKIIDGRYSHTQHISAFSGFFPIEKPEIVVTVVIDSPKSKGVAYGIRIAAPSFQRVGRQIAQYYNQLY